MKDTIRHEFTFPQAPEIVWDYLTDPELLAQWLMPSDFSPVVGHKFQFGTKPKYRFAFDGRIYCEVLEIIPCKKLVYSWRGGISGEKPTLDSVVTWTLNPLNGGTRLTLEHKGFRGIKNFFPYLIMNKGWKKIGTRFLKQLNTVQI